MALIMPNAARFYKISALSGLVIIILVITFSWMRMKEFEQSVAVVFEQIVVTNMEVNGLKEELMHINKVLDTVGGPEAMTTKEEIIVDDIAYSKYAIERLKNDKKNIVLHIREKELDLAETSGVKKHVMNEVRLLFGVALIFLLLGTIMAVFGFLAWYFKVELFEDRRRAPRK
jgi:hypothetical protein